MDSSRLDPFKEMMARPGRPDYESVLEALLEEIFAERGCMWLEKDNAFLYRGDDELRKRFPFSRQAVDSVLEKGRSFIAYDDGGKEPASPTSSMLMNNVRSCVCAAAKNAQGEVLVLAYFDNGPESDPFSIEDLELVQGVLDMVPGAVSSD